GTGELEERRQAEWLETRARLYFEQKRDDDALADLAKAGTLAWKLTNIPVLLRVGLLYGELFARQNNLDRAHKEFKEAAVLASKYGLDVVAARALKEIARFVEKRDGFSVAYWAAYKAGELMLRHGEQDDIVLHMVEDY